MISTGLDNINPKEFLDLCLLCPKFNLMDFRFVGCSAYLSVISSSKKFTKQDLKKLDAWMEEFSKARIEN